MARPSEKATLLNTRPPAEKLPFPLGLVSPGVRPYLELIRLHKVRYLSRGLTRSWLTFHSSPLAPSSCSGRSVSYDVYLDKPLFIANFSMGTYDGCLSHEPGLANLLDRVVQVLYCCNDGARLCLHHQ